MFGITITSLVICVGPPSLKVIPAVVFRSMFAPFGRLCNNATVDRPGLCHCWLNYEIGAGNGHDLVCLREWLGWPNCATAQLQGNMIRLSTAVTGSAECADVIGDKRGLFD